MTLATGTRVGRYRVRARVGEGGMAEVFEAEDDLLRRTVALKAVRPTVLEDPGAVERFLQEARVVAALDHPHVIPVYDAGEHDRRPFLVMPFVPGGSLAERLRQGAVPPGEAISWVRQLAAALDAAHAAGVLHRDVKPANVLMLAPDRVALADFGIARLVGTSSGLTATGTVVGTPAYMAPEVVRGEGASASSDRYALAVVAWELLVGRPPFVGDNPLSVLHQHVTAPVPAITEAAPRLPQALDRVFRRALAKDAAVRPATAAELADELEEAVVGGARATTVSLPTAPRPRPRSAVLAALLAVLLSALAIAWLLSRERATSASPEVAIEVAPPDAPGGAVRAAPPPPSSSEPVPPGSGSAVPPATATEGVEIAVRRPAEGGPQAPDPQAAAAASRPPLAEMRQALGLPASPRDRDAFVALVGLAERLPDDGPAAGAGEAAARLGRGGLALLAGDREAAAREAAVLVAGAGRLPWGAAWPAVAFAPLGDQGLELVFGTTPDREPADPLATAYLAHLRGDHRAALSAVDGETGSLAAQIAAHEAAEIGDAESVRKWLPAAVGGSSGAPAPVARTFLTELVAIARTQAPGIGRRVAEEACRAGMEEACGRLGARAPTEASPARRRRPPGPARHGERSGGPESV